MGFKLSSLLPIVITHTAFALTTYTPPFDAAINSHSQMTVKYYGVGDYNFLYCTANDDTDYSVMASWKHEGGVLTAPIRGLILDCSNSNRTGTMHIQNNTDKKNITIHCEYFFEPPSVHQASLKCP